VIWRVARSLDVLLDQLNARFPHRSKASDGSIGDANHLAEGWDQSDHNPWYPKPAGGIVTARDFTHDPVNGVDIARLSDELAASRDRRIKYIIANGLILDSRPQFKPWQWVRYTGSNRHDHHLHLSVMPNFSDDIRPWNLPMLTGITPKPLPDSGTRPQLHLGDEGEHVRLLQVDLNKHFASYSRLLADGIYGPATAAVIKEFQHRTGITGADADGTVVGPRTVAKLISYGLVW
jgi:hypothetical protein